jgi:threonine dehydrogenase-like Zn-dependent dehydrogenase
VSGAGVVGRRWVGFESVGRRRVGSRFDELRRVPHGVTLKGEDLFRTHVHLHGGPAPVRRYMPYPTDLVWNRKIDPGKVFDLTFPLEKVAQGYRAMDQRQAIKNLLRP